MHEEAKHRFDVNENEIMQKLKKKSCRGTLMCVGAKAVFFNLWF